MINGVEVTCCVCGIKYFITEFAVNHYSEYYCSQKCHSLTPIDRIEEII